MLSSIEALSSIQHIPIGSDISYNGSKYNLKYFYVLASHHMTSQRGCLAGGVEIWQLLAFCAIAGKLFFWMRVENHFIRSNSTVDNTYIKIPAENNICGEDWSKLNLVPKVGGGKATLWMRHTADCMWACLQSRESTTLK